MMLTEIREQPRALARTLAAESKRIVRLRRLIEQRRPKLIVLAARGTSDNAAQFGRYLIEVTTGIPVSLAAPSVTTLYNAQIDMSSAMVVAVSQSGESTDTNYVLERAKAQGALTVGVTNEASSTLAQLADHTVLVRAGKERSVAATKTYTGQLLAMYLIAQALGAAIPNEALERLPEAAEQALSLEPEVSALAPRYRFMERAVVVGRGLNYSNAFEFALKMMETSYVVAERFSSADLLHGPIAMVEAAFPVFLFAPGGATWQPLREMIAKLREMQAETLVITDEAHRSAAKEATRSIVIPAKLSTGKIPDLFTPIPYIIPAQLFAAHLASEKGLNPDKPRTLTKVTRTL